MLIRTQNNLGRCAWTPCLEDLRYGHASGGDAPPSGHLSATRPGMVSDFGKYVELEETSQDEIRKRSHRV